MMTNGKIAAAVVGGYLLGRTGKGKLALSLGMMLAGRKLSLNPQDLAKNLAGSPLLAGLSDQVRKELVEGTKSAAGSALEARMNSLADSLRERSAALEDGDAGRDRDEDEGEEDTPAADEGEPEEDEPEEDEPEAPPARKTAKKAQKAQKATGAARGTTGTARRTTPARTTKKVARTAKATGTRSAKTARGGGDE